MSSIYGLRISIGVHSSICLKPTRVCYPLTRIYKGILRRLGVWSLRPSNGCRSLTMVTCSMPFFYPGRGKPGSRLPVVYNYGGADGILLRGEDGGAGQYVRRGMSFIDVDGPGHGGTLRYHKLYAPPDSERVAKAVIDYLVTRPDVDVERIGLHGSSMGGYSGPRCATMEQRIKAVAVWSGAYNLVDDIFDYYPPIQERLRWLMGAKNLNDAREKIKEFTLIGRANKIDCALLVGYSIDDRVMDPRGALNLYENAVNSPDRSMVDGVGHGQKKFDKRTYIADWFMKQLKAG